MERFLDENNFGATDIPLFVGVHTALSVALVSSTWYLFYVASMRWGQPVTSLPNTGSLQSKSLLLRSVLSSPRVPTSMQTRALSILEKVDASSQNSKIIDFLTGHYSTVDPTRLAISFLEAKFARLFLKPFTIPGRIWLSWKATKTWKHQYQPPSLVAQVSEFETSKYGMNRITEQNTPAINGRFPDLGGYRSAITNCSRRNRLDRAVLQCRSMSFTANPTGLRS